MRIDLRSSRRATVAALATLFVLSAGSVSTLGCSCAPPPELSVAVGQADAVFAGRVVGLTLNPASPEDPTSSFMPEDLVVTFVVSRVWKWPTGEAGDGITRMTAIVMTAFTCCVCGYPFEIGETYLVFAQGDADSLRTSICTRTVHWAEASEDVDALGDPLLPVTTPGPASPTTP